MMWVWTQTDIFRCPSGRLRIFFNFRSDGKEKEEWHGGKVHIIRPSVLHLMRGQVFEIEGKKLFAFGGASSHDISGGILEPDDPAFKKKKRELDRDWKPYRIHHVSWWEQELPSQEEMEEGRKTLAAHGNKVVFRTLPCEQVCARKGDRNIREYF